MFINVAVSRTLLSLPSLVINDHEKYTLSSSVFGGAVTFQTNWITSPYVDGDIAHSRRRGNVTDSIAIYVEGDTHAEVLTNLQTLVNAFQQDRFSLVLTYDGATYQYECSASDYTLSWDTAHLNANRVLITFNVPRGPVPTKGI